MEIKMNNKIMMGFLFSFCFFSSVVTQAAVETEDAEAQISTLKAKLKGKYYG